MEKTLFKKVTILTMLQESVFDGDILVNGQTIEAIGEIPSHLLTDCELTVIDGNGTVAMPGLINTHTHASMTLLRSYADDMALMPWLNDKIWPAEARMTDEHIYWGAKLAIIEMIKSGTTTFADMYDHMDQVAQAVSEMGIRANLSRGITQFGDEGIFAKIAENKALFDQWNNTCEGRIQVWFGPHAPYTCSPEYLSKIVDAAKEAKTGLHVHVAETMDEIKTIKEQYGKTPVEYLNDLGVFDLPALAAHCVYLTDSDMDILIEKNVGVAHNVISNLKLASGFAQMPKFMTKGGRVGLGTDGASSNNSQNMFKEINVCSLVHKAQMMDPTAMNAYDVLKLATIGGAKALQWDKEIGTLEVGKKADIILVDINKPHFCPYHNVIADLVYSAQGSDVKTVMINGKLLMQDYQLLGIDEQAIMKEAKRCAQAIIG